ncbi:MAG: DUF4139 domain-containing protein [Flavobacteriales bacterium]|nr:DUF4139 domain-containing protein [Flavobacteriales bacterium]
MKNLLIIMALLVAQVALAQEKAIEEKELSSEVSEVTVYFKGAQVKRVKPLKLKPGKYRLVFDGLEPDLIDNSLQVKVDDGLVINYVNKRSNFLKRLEKNAKAEALQKSIDSLQVLIEDESDVLALYQNQEKLLALNNEIGGQQEGVKVDELIQTVAFYEVKLKEVKAKQRKSHRRIKELEKLLHEKSAQKQEITSIVPTKTSEIVVEASCEDTFKGGITLKYIIPNAGWTPIYDLRAEEIDEPIKLILKANVRQSSGSDWKDVKLNLTSENPLESGQMPELKRWDVGSLRAPESLTPEQIREDPIAGLGEIKGIVVDASNNEAIPFANVVLMNQGQQVTGSSTDFDGMYHLKSVNAGRYSLKASCVGYTAQDLKNVIVNGDKMTTADFRMKPGVKLDEVCIINYEVPLVSAMGSAGATFSGNRFSGSNNVGSGGIPIVQVTSQEIVKMPSRGAAAAVTTAAGVQNNDYLRGSRFQDADGLIEGGRGPLYSHPMDRALASTSGVVYNSNFQPLNKRISINTTIAKKETRVFYKVETPFTVLSDDKDYTVQIDELQINALMSYYSAPIEVPHAFLVAKITDWERFDLLEGVVSLYVSGTYIGQSLLDPANTGDTMLVSLGSDKSIVVEREELKEFSKQQIIGNKTVDYRGYTIKLKNNKDKLVRLELQDQLPVSTTRDVAIQLIETEDVKLDEDKGILDWKLTLLPGESKQVTFKYFVKRPSWKQVQLE